MDKTYKRQLEKFGTEQVRVTHGNSEKKKIEEQRQSMLSIVRMIMETMQGRQWMWSKLDMCGVFTSPIVTGDPYGTHFLSGAQAVGHNLLADIMAASADKFALMSQEAAARKAGVEPETEE